MSAPAERWDLERAYSPDVAPARMSLYARHGCFIINGVACFDAPAFRIPRNEAAALDPQQRLLLEEVGAALADAGNATGDAIGAFTGALKRCRCLTSQLPHRL